MNVLLDLESYLFVVLCSALRQPDCNSWNRLHTHKDPNDANVSKETPPVLLVFDRFHQMYLVGNGNAGLFIRLVQENNLQISFGSTHERLPI